MIKVAFNYSGGTESWQKELMLPAVPREGDVIETLEGTSYSVHTVVWYPWGEIDNENSTDPFVYVVLKGGL